MRKENLQAIKSFVNATITEHTYTVKRKYYTAGYSAIAGIYSCISLPFIRLVRYNIAGLEEK